MTRLASHFGSARLIRRDRILTDKELIHYVPSVFSEEKHISHSDRYTYIPIITFLDNMRRVGKITGEKLSEIILLNSNDSSYQMVLGIARFVYINGGGLWTDIW